MSRKLGAAAAALEALAGTRRGAAWLLAVALAVYAVQSVALPLIPGRDLGTYLRVWVQLDEWHSVLPMTMLYRTPLAPVVIGAPLDFLGGAATQVWMGLLYAGSVVAWSAATVRGFGPRAGLLVAAALLVYPGYGILFHTVSSDSVFAAVFAAWGFLLVRAVVRPTATAFALAGLASAACGLTRPANQVLVVLAAAPLVLALPWRRRLALAGSYLAVAVAILGLWGVNNGVRYSDWAVARGGAAYLPFFRAFVEDRIVEPENGPVSRELARAVEERLLDEEPYRSYGIDLEEFFSAGSDRMFEDVLGLSDRVWGWDSDYEKLREVGLEAVRAHPGAFLRGVASTLGGELWKPLYVELARSEAGEGQVGDEDADTIVVDGRRLPRPSEGDVIPAARQGFYSTTPDGSVFEVWTSPTEHRVVFPTAEATRRFERLDEEIGGLAEKLPPYHVSSTLTLWLSRSSRLYPRPLLWLGVGGVFLLARRPRRAWLAVTLAGASLGLLSISALGTYEIIELAIPVVPAFVVLAAAGIAGERRGSDVHPAALTSPPAGV